MVGEIRKLYILNHEVVCEEYYEGQSKRKTENNIGVIYNDGRTITIDGNFMNTPSPLVEYTCDNELVLDISEEAYKIKFKKNHNSLEVIVDAPNSRITSLKINSEREYFSSYYINNGIIIFS